MKLMYVFHFTNLTLYTSDKYSNFTHDFGERPQTLRKYNAEPRLVGKRDGTRYLSEDE